MDDPRRSTGFWNADTQQFQREEAEAHQDIKGCCIYLVFLCTFIGTVLAGGTASPDAFWTSSSVKGEIITFNRIVADEIMDWGDLSEIKRFWHYMKRVILDEIVNEEDYNGNAITEDGDGHLYTFQNHLILMGGVRLRQYRVQSDVCTYREQAFKCYTHHELTETMKMPNLGHDIEWTSKSENNETPYYRGAHGSYPGSGFVVMLPRHEANATAIVDALKQDLWIDGHTRMISIDFNLFNPTTGLHTVVRVVFEFGRTAATTPSRSIRTWRFMRYENNIAAIIFDWCCAIFVILTIISELKEYLCEEKWCKCKKDDSYWNIWNVLDWVCLIFNLVIGLLILCTWIEAEKIDLLNQETYVSLLYLEYMLTVTNYFIMICGMFLFLKLFKYMTFSSRLTFLFTMLRRSGLDILIFMSLLMIFVSSFGFGGYVLFNTDVIEFRQLHYAIGNMFRAIVSDLDYNMLLGETQVDNWIFASLYYVVWGVFVILVLSNVFIAILSESYANVQIDFDRDLNLKQIWKKARRMFKIQRKKEKKPHKEKEQGSSDQASEHTELLPRLTDASDQDSDPEDRRNLMRGLRSMKFRMSEHDL